MHAVQSDVLWRVLLFAYVSSILMQLRDTGITLPMEYHSSFLKYRRWYNSRVLQSLQQQRSVFRELSKGKTGISSFSVRSCLSLFDHVFSLFHPLRIATRIRSSFNEAMSNKEIRNSGKTRFFLAFATVSSILATCFFPHVHA